MGAVEVGTFLVDEQAAAAAVEAAVDDANSALRLKLEELFGAPRVPVNLFFAVGPTLFVLSTDSEVRACPIAEGTPVAVTALCGAAEGTAFAVIDNELRFCFLNHDGGSTSAPAVRKEVTGLPPDAVLNGLCTNPATGELIILAGEKFYVGEIPESAPAGITVTEWIDAGFDAGTTSCVCAVADTTPFGGSDAGVWVVAPNGGLWIASPTVPAMELVPPDDGVVRYISTDPTTAPDYNLWYSVDGQGISAPFQARVASVNPYPQAAYNDIVYAATSTKIVQYKAGQATKTVLDDVTASLIAVSTS